MTGKIKAGLGGALIFCMALIGNCRAGETSEFVLTNRTFRSGDFEVKMLDNGNIEIYGEGRLLTSCNTDLAYKGITFPSPEILADEKKQELTMKFSKASGEGVRLFYTRRLRIVGNTIELTSTYPADFLSSVDMEGIGYDGGRWQCGPDSGKMIARAVELTATEWVSWAIQTKDGQGYYPVKQISFWQKAKKIGFSITNTKDNGMILYDWGNKGLTSYHLWMSAINDGGIWRTTQIIAPAYRSEQDMARDVVASNISISFPANEREGYFPVGYSLPAEVTILPAKESAGNYTAEFLLLDQTDREVMKKEMAFSVTEKEAGKVKLDFVTPNECALCWMRISVRNKEGNVLLSREYPFAVTVKLPHIKDIPASSPLGGQPLAGGYMPEGRLVGMKWDRFWSNETNWRDIETEKGKFNWEKTDRMVEEAITAGNEILWCLCRTPNWASRMPQEKIYDAIKAQYPVAPKLKLNLETSSGRLISMESPPKDIKDWENFVRAVVSRYKDRVHYWQIWNEPWWDRKKFGKPVGDEILWLNEEYGRVVDASPWGFGGTMGDYVKLVKSASKIIHEEDPKGRVVVYGDYCARDSMDEFYKTGVGDYIDILCLHYFYLDYCTTKKNIPPSGYWANNQKAQAMSVTATDNIIRYFDRDHFKYTGKHVPIWNTEEGRYRCSWQGRSGPRPLTQKECEKIYGEKSRGVEDSKGSERQNACWEVESFLFSLGVGMDKVFLHCGHSVSVPSLGKADYKLPTEKGIAWAAMASVLSTSKEVKYSPMGNKELDAVTITDISGKKTAVVWSHTGERKVHVRIPVGKNKKFKGLDFLGNPVELQAGQGWLKIDVNEEPLYIHDLDLGGIFASDRSFLSIKDEKDVEVVEAGKPYAGEITVGNPYISSYSIDGVLESSVKPSGKIMIEKGVKLAPGEEKMVPFNIIVEGGEEVQVEFVLKDQGAELGRLKKTYSITRYQKRTPLPKCPRAMKVDCEAGDWEGMAEHKVDTADRVLVGLETPVYEKAPVRNWQGPSDLSFSVKSCWQEDGLYFLVEVKDNEVNPGPGPSYKWDCVEFFVDMRDAAGQSKKEKTPGAVQFSVQPGLGDIPQECKIVFAGNDGKYAKAFFMGRKTKTGYVVEGKVEPVGIQLKEGMPIGLDVAVDDGKEPNLENLEDRKSQMVWMGTEDNYQNPSKWGKFYLGQ